MPGARYNALGWSPHRPTSESRWTLATADAEFLADRFAKTSQAPRESRWSTWKKMAEHRGLEPLPVTVDLVFALGSLFKAAKYRSSAQYFAVAKCKPSSWTWRGPRRPVRSSGGWDRRLDFSASLASAYDELEVPLTVCVKEPFVTALTAVWFLLRGIEIANVVGNDVRFNKANRSVTVRLPVSKTDTEGKGCERTHICICSPRHVPGCAASTPPALMFTSLQKCSCRHPLCVFHALLDLVVRKRRTGSQAPLFGDEGVPPSAKQLTKLAQVCAFVLHNEALHEWSPAAIEKWSQHCFRVSGAQLFARAEVTLPVIQVIGRWGSFAIWCYVQESVFAPQRQLHSFAFPAKPLRVSFAHRPPPARGSMRPQCRPWSIAWLPSPGKVRLRWYTTRRRSSLTSRARTNSACRVLTGLLLVAGGTTAAATTLDTRPSCQGFQGAPSVLQVRPSLVR